MVHLVADRGAADAADVIVFVPVGEDEKEPLSDGDGALAFWTVDLRGVEAAVAAAVRLSLVIIGHCYSTSPGIF